MRNVLIIKAVIGFHNEMCLHFSSPKMSLRKIPKQPFPLYDQLNFKIKAKIDRYHVFQYEHDIFTFYEVVLEC